VKGRLLLRAVAVVSALLALAGCGIGAESQPQLLPSASADVAPTTAPSPPATRQVTIYLVDDEGRLRAVTVGGRPGPRVSSSLDSLLQVGTTLTPPAGLRSLIPRGTTLGRVVVYPQDILVELGPQFLSLTGRDQVLATAQLVFTTTEYRPGARVRLSVDDREIPVPVGDGSLRSAPVSRDDYRQMVATPEPSAPPTSTP
jgi:hypothetical protein